MSVVLNVSISKNSDFLYYIWLKIEKPENIGGSITDNEALYYFVRQYAVWQ
jgi:hypothetical protein